MLTTKTPPRAARWICALAVLLLSCGMLADARADFIINNTNLNTGKVDLFPLPSTANPNNFIVAADYNAVTQALLDTRNAIIGGKLSGYTCQSTRPTTPVATQFVWCDSTFSPGHLKFYNGSTDIDLSLGGASIGNFVFSGNTVDLSGAAQISVGLTTATAIVLGQDVLFGRGDGSGSVVGVKARGPNPSGANIAGADFIIQPSLATGNAATGSTRIKYAPVLGSGVTQQTPADAVVVNGSTGVTTFNFGVVETQSALGTSTTTSGILNQNPTVSLVGAQQQYSGLFENCGHGWQAGGVNADQLVCAALQQRPQPGTSLAATSRLVLSNKYGGGSYADSLFIDTDTTNVTTFTASVATQTTIALGASLGLHGNSSVIRTDTLWPWADGDQAGEPTVPVAFDMIGRVFMGRRQTPAFSAGMNFNPALGELIEITATANMGTWTLTTPPAGANNTHQCFVLKIIQDGTGSRTIGTPPGVIKWLPTAYRGTTHTAPTLTTTAGKIDYLGFCSDNTSGTFIQVYENLNN